jgi:hypothetical protein
MIIAPGAQSKQSRIILPVVEEFKSAHPNVTKWNLSAKKNHLRSFFNHFEGNEQGYLDSEFLNLVYCITLLLVNVRPHVYTMGTLLHTIDSLCQPEKQKLFDMLKQLTELKKRCTGLEEELGSRQLEIERLTEREDIQAKQLEATQTKLLESLESVNGTHHEIEELSLQLQAAESNQKGLTVRLHDLESESQSHRENIQRYRQKHERPLISTSVQAAVPSCDRACNTTDSAVSLQATDTQTPAPTSRSPIGFPSPPGARGRRSAEPDSSTIPSQIQYEADYELDQLIMILNPL